jgi:hypothetical protein
MGGTRVPGYYKYCGYIDLLNHVIFPDGVPTQGEALEAGWDLALWLFRPKLESDHDVNNWIELIKLFTRDLVYTSMVL